MMDKTLLERAQAEARAFGHVYIRAEHILLALLQDPQSAASRQLARDGLSAEAVRAELVALPCPTCAAVGGGELAMGAKRAWAWAAERVKGDAPMELVLLAAVLRYSPVARGLLERLGMDCEALYREVMKDIGE